MSQTTDLILGAVAYDQKVVPIWDGFLQYFRARGLPFDYVLFSNYERQVEAQIHGLVDLAVRDLEARRHEDAGMINAPRPFSCGGSLQPYNAGPDSGDGAGSNL